MADETAADKARSWLAFVITIVSLIGVIALAWVMIYSDTKNATQVLATVLPVIGTWVGTILAFYFGKANFESAAKSVGDLAKQLTPQEKLRSIPVKSKWIPRDSMFFKTAPIDAMKIADVLKQIEDNNKGERLPVLTDKFLAKDIIHRSMLDFYIARKARAGAANIADLTFGDLFRDEPDLEKMFSTSFATVKQDATLADAKAAMEQTKNCEDVFVTADGTASTEVLGWVTDNIIQANLQA